MAETMLALVCLMVPIVFWGNTEVMMQQHERQAVKQVQAARQQYETRQLAANKRSKKIVQ